MNFTTQTLKSNYLETDFEVSCWEMKQNGRTITIVEHAAIEDIIFNKVAKEGFTYELEPIIGVSNHPVFKCTMTDGYMRKVIAIGEAEPSTLVNKISRQNPAIMAANRAFDRAAIRYLNLDGDGKFLSSTEMPEDCEEQNEELTSDMDAAQNEEPLFADSHEEAVTPDQHAQTQEPETPQDPGEVIINFGKYRNKNMTVAEICATDESWANYTATMNVDKAGEFTKRQVQAIKDYRNAHQQ